MKATAPVPSLVGAALLAACSSASVDRPTNEEMQQLDEAEAMLDRLDAQEVGVENAQEAE